MLRGCQLTAAERFVGAAGPLNEVVAPNAPMFGADPVRRAVPDESEYNQIWSPRERVIPVANVRVLVE